MHHLMLRIRSEKCAHRKSVFGGSHRVYLQRLSWLLHQQAILLCEINIIYVDHH